MKIKNKKLYNCHYIEYSHKNIRGNYFDDKSGRLEINDEDGYSRHFCDEGSFKYKLRGVKKLANFYTRAYKDLLVVDKKLKTIKLEKDEN